jgi:hypothetical protein
MTPALSALTYAECAATYVIDDVDDSEMLAVRDGVVDSEFVVDGDGL